MIAPIQGCFSFPVGDALPLVRPILMYWLARALFMANRRLMNDDPIVFALKDRNSLLAFALVTAIMVVAA